jgi:cellulose synthase/poly-beta-1,6-N-acetylglucosamine synthase-like glycosyltransferase
MIAVGVLVLTILGLPVLACATYLVALALAARPAAVAPRDDRRAPRLRFDLIVPAHDEEAGIGATLSSLRALDYPADRVRILVVADNCADATARVAAAAGALVIERRDPLRRGKGYALARGFERALADAVADVVVVIDADTTVSSNLLRAFATRFEAGAGAAQASYGVRDPDASWRSRLMVIALAVFHGVRSLGRERLGLSVGLRGNGMGFAREVLRRVPADAYSVVEDVEYGIKLAEAGVRIGYVPEAGVLGDMAPRGAAAATQRRRWEGGRATIAAAHAPRLLREGLARRDATRLDLAMDLLVPPLSSLVLVAVLGALAALAWHLALGGSATILAPWLLSVAFLTAYVLRGASLSGAGPRGLLTLLWAPVYVAWKVGLRLRRSPRGNQEWIRTARDGGRS